VKECATFPPGHLHRARGAGTAAAAGGFGGLGLASPLRCRVAACATPTFSEHAEASATSMEAAVWRTLALPDGTAEETVGAGSSAAAAAAALAEGDEASGLCCLF